MTEEDIRCSKLKDQIENNGYNLDLEEDPDWLTSPCANWRGSYIAPEDRPGVRPRLRGGGVWSSTKRRRKTNRKKSSRRRKSLKIRKR